LPLGTNGGDQESGGDHTIDDLEAGWLTGQHDEAGHDGAEDYVQRTRKRACPGTGTRWHRRGLPTSARSELSCAAVVAVMWPDMSPDLAGHLKIALAAHKKWLRGLGLPVPAYVTEFHDAVAFRASKGHVGPLVDRLADLREVAVVAPRLLTITQAAQALSCSETTVKRLVTKGLLPAKRLGDGATRIRIEDLDHYVDSLQPAARTRPLCQESA
jgi:excisionase family DNA binding protein